MRREKGRDDGFDGSDYTPRSYLRQAEPEKAVQPMAVLGERWVGARDFDMILR
jgi:hypothetical protein